jgi:6-phosphogluconolactonase
VSGPSVRVLPDADAVARAGAEVIAHELRVAAEARGLASVALSGGRTPWIMLGHLAGMPVPWDRVQVFQVDERVAPDGDPDRNLTHLNTTLLREADLPPGNVHPMPVTAPDLALASDGYATELRDLPAGRLDLVHLGLGDDGHTASLAPGDPVLAEDVRLVATTTRPFNGHVRMTLTYPALRSARRILWIVTGDEKAPPLLRMLGADGAVPAGRVPQENAIVLCDAAAAAELPAGLGR